MHNYADKTGDKYGKSVANSFPAKKGNPLQCRPASVAQRLVINTGSTGLEEEMNSKQGWIVASDLNIALRRGGWFQKVVELREVATASVGKTENIYLMGHGGPGLLGDEVPTDVAREIKKILPQDYQGEIRSMSCSAGVGLAGHFGGLSGVEQLAKALNVPGVKVIGAAGIALNHPAYENDTRAFTQAESGVVDAEINRTIKEVNDVWAIYLKLFPGDNYRVKAEVASLLSKEFYLALEAKVNDHLIEKGATFKKAEI